MVQKKIPMRQCLGCREMFPKRELIRVVRSPEGEITLDFKGKAPGRGAYLCGRPDCLKQARKRRAIERAVRTGEAYRPAFWEKAHPGWQCKSIRVEYNEYQRGYYVRLEFWRERNTP